MSATPYSALSNALDWVEQQQSMLAGFQALLCGGDFDAAAHDNIALLHSHLMAGLLEAQADVRTWFEAIAVPSGDPDTPTP